MMVRRDEADQWPIEHLARQEQQREIMFGAPELRSISGQIASAPVTA
jgi:hypothetical protein